jgi:hypothetical protein
MGGPPDFDFCDEDDIRAFIKAERAVGMRKPPPLREVAPGEGIHEAITQRSSLT